MFKGNTVAVTGLVAEAGDISMKMGDLVCQRGALIKGGK